MYIADHLNVPRAVESSDTVNWDILLYKNGAVNFKMNGETQIFIPAWINTLKEEDTCSQRSSLLALSICSEVVKLMPDLR